MLQLPFRLFLYGDLSPLAYGTRFGTVFIAMTLGFALVTAALYLAWLVERRWLLWVAFALGLVFARGCRSPGTRRRSAAFVAVGARGLRAPDGGDALGRRARAAARRRVAGRAGAAADGVPRFSRLATVLVAVLLAPGRTSASSACPTCTTSGRRGTGTCCS
jgi:hypothetical protein